MRKVDWLYLIAVVGYSVGDPVKLLPSSGGLKMKLLKKVILVSALAIFATTSLA